MTTVLAFFSGILNGVRALVGLVLPIFSEAADFRNWPGWLRVLIGLALLAGCCVGLYFIQKAVNLNYYLPKLPPTVRDYFLPMIFVLLVIFSWLAFWLWKLLTAEDDEAEFTDIREEWEEATARMSAAGIKIGDFPLFLVLGRPAAGLDSLFLAAGVKDIVRTPSLGAGGKGDPSLRVYAWDEAIFVVCPGASAWGKFCVELTNPTDSFQSAAAEGGAPAGATLAPGTAFAGMDQGARAEMEALLSESSRRELTYEEQTRLRDLVEQLNSAPVALKKAVAISDEERSKLTRRLRYLCKLIRRDRRPWCPINGVLTVIPWTATDGNDLVNIGSGLLEQELMAARDVFQLRYPTFAVVSDLEVNRGFAEFRSGFRADMLKQRIGQRFPLVPVGKPEEITNLVAGVARWIGLSVLPRWILEFLRLENPSDPRRSAAQGAVHNRNLYLLMRAVFDRGPRLAELLSRGLPPVGGSDEMANVPMLGGCYLAATGRAEGEQAFVEGVFKRIIESQSSVSWSPEALAADARLKRLALLGYIFVVLFALGSGAAVYFLLQMK